jgi:predicted RNase H-like nuclease (RuvC/YqgF family)
MDKKVKLFGFTITKSVTPEVAALQSDIKYLKEEREELLDMISKLDTKINEYDVKKYDEIKKLKEAKDKEYKELQYNTDLALKRKDGEIDLLRAEDSKQYTKQIATLE